MQIDLKKLKLEKVVIRHSLDIYNLIGYVIRNKKKLFNLLKEHLFVLSLDQASYALSLELIALGSSSNVMADPIEVFSLPVYKRAAGVILIHNHPSGILTPSEEDKDVTNRLIQGGRILKRPILDHVIISEHSYYSFKDSGLLEALECSSKYVAPYEIEEQLLAEMDKEIKRIKKQNRIKLEKKITQSLQKGKEEGERIGLEKGKIEIAKSMLEEKEPIEKIIKWTGLSREDLKKLSL